MNGKWSLWSSRTRRANHMLTATTTPRATIIDMKKACSLIALAGFSLYTLHYFLSAAKPPKLFFRRRTPSSSSSSSSSKPKERQEEEEEEAKRIRLSAEEIAERCPILFKRYFPLFLCTNAHLSTFVAAFLRSKPSIRFRREVLLTADGGHMTLDWSLNRSDSETRGEEEEEEGCFWAWERERAKPTIIIFHGLNGGSDATYIRHLIKRLNADMGEDNVRIVVANNRGAAGTVISTPRGYCGAYTEDARAAILHVKRRIHPDSPLIAIGYSLGANILVKYLGEEGEKTPLTAAASCSNPFDFLSAAKVLERRTLYNRVLTAGCIQTFKRQLAIYSAVPEIDVDAVINSVRLREFDDRLTRIIFGYDTVDDYYFDASSRFYIPAVKVPLLVIHAKDDPIVDHSTLPLQECSESAHTLFVLTEKGGHVGFPEGVIPVGNIGNWSDRVLSQFISAVVALHREKQQEDEDEREEEA
ncbi:medium-chain fatty acid ethyl ester synthase/esterase 2 [Balamuthia mandrillaris]